MNVQNFPEFRKMERFGFLVLVTATLASMVQGKAFPGNSLASPVQPQFANFNASVIFDDIEPRQIGSYYGVRKFSCGSHVLDSGDRGLIQTPNFQVDNYPDAYHCEWSFKTTDSCILNVRCLSVNIAESPDCSKDYLEVDNHSGFREKFCGDYVPSGFIVSDNDSLGIEFHSDSDEISDLGFACAVSCRPKEPEKPRPPMNCKCGKSQTGNRIVGGQETVPHAYPWMVALSYRNGQRPFCGASLINNRYVLTAAHCIDGLLRPLEVRVLLKGHDFSNNQSDILIRMNISEAIPHESYNRKKTDYDIALLKLAEPLNEDLFQGENALGTVCLPPKDQDPDFEGLFAKVTGWGTTTEGGKLSPVLKEVDVQVLNQEKCNIQMNNKITERMLCAGYDEGIKDSCQGDSGGPLILKDVLEDRYTQIGIVSWGIGCARENKPGIYTRMTEFYDWIAENTRGSLWCQA